MCEQQCCQTQWKGRPYIPTPVATKDCKHRSSWLLSSKTGFAGNGPCYVNCSKTRNLLLQLQALLKATGPSNAAITLPSVRNKHTFVPRPAGLPQRLSKSRSCTIRSHLFRSMFWMAWDCGVDKLGAPFWTCRCELRSPCRVCIARKDQEGTSNTSWESAGAASSFSLLCVALIN
jgi:hypothetical protein